LIVLIHCFLTTESEFWRKSAEALLAEKEKLKQQYGTARNIIFFLGDGMSIPTLMAARVEQGRRNKIAGPEKEQLSFEKFPFVGLSKVNMTTQLISFTDLRQSTSCELMILAFLLC